MSTNPKIFIKRLIEKLNYKDLIIEQQKSFIQQQDKMLELAINAVARHCCPGSDETVEQIHTCPEGASVTLVQCADCWRKYLQGEVGK